MNHQHQHRPDAGFSLLELAVSTGIAALVITSSLLIFDVNSRVSRVQIQVSDLQQSQRVAQQEMVRYLRMAGRGGLPQRWGVSVRDDVPVGFQIAGNPVMTGTDVLTVRGVFNSPVLHVQSIGGGFSWDAASFTGSLTVDTKTRAGILQPLDAITDAIASGRPDSLLMISTFDPTVYAVVEITGGGIGPWDIDGDGDIEPDEQRATVNFKADPGGGAHEMGYTQMSQGGAFPPGLRSAAYVGILEEYRFYIRDTTATAVAEPKLSRARMFPNTQLVHGDVGSGRVDIADNVLDLQVALAVDLNLDRLIDDMSPPDLDEWLFNNPGGSDVGETDSLWGGLDVDLPWVNGTLFEIRLNTLVRTDRPDPRYQSDPLISIENREYNEPADVPAGDVDAAFERSFRRRNMQTRVDLRNLG